MVQEPRRCRCGSTDISPGNRARRPLCRECMREFYKAHNQKPERRRRTLIQRLSYQRGCDTETVLRCRSSRCVICNVPPWTLDRYGLGPMQVGHLVPADPSGGFESMCKKCNKYLGARTLTQVTGREVLRKSRRYWSRLQMRDEPWQHTDVDERGYGTGGVNESPGRQRKLDRFEEERDARREQREGEGRRTDPRGDGLPPIGADGSVVLEDPADQRDQED